VLTELLHVEELIGFIRLSFHSNSAAVVRLCAAPSHAQCLNPTGATCAAPADRGVFTLQQLHSTKQCFGHEQWGMLRILQYLVAMNWSSPGKLAVKSSGLGQKDIPDSPV